MPELHDYQKVAVEHLQRNPRAGLFLDMGLGKTAATLRSLRPEDLPVLVVAPKRVATDVWPLETQVWRPDLTLSRATEGPAQRQQALRADTDIVVIGRDVIADAVPLAKRFKTFVLDELSSFKSNTAGRSRAALKIANVTPKVVGLTGTPSPNGLLDLWHQMKILDGGARLGKNKGGYQSRYFTPGWQLPNGVVTSWDIRPGADKRIHALIDDICLSMSSDGRIELPPLTLNKVSVPLVGPAKTLYKEFQKTLVADMEVLGGEVHTAGSAAILSSKLSQVTAGFMYVDDADLRDGQYDVVHRAKIDALIEILDGTGNPVLVFYRYKAEKEMIMAALKGRAHTIDEKDSIVRWNRGELPVLLAHPASAGHGLNLQHGGSTIVWTSLTWSLEEWEQGNKRLHRQGQKDPVIIHTLVSPGTVDEAIVARLTEKKTVQQALMDHLESPL